MNNREVKKTDSQIKKFAVYDDIRDALAARHNEELTKYYHHKVTFIEPIKKQTITILGEKVNMASFTCSCEEFKSLKEQSFGVDCIDSFCIHLSKAILYKTKHDRLSKLLLDSKLKGTKEKLIRFSVENESCIVGKPILENTDWINIYISWQDGTKWSHYSYNLARKEWSHSIKPDKFISIEQFLHRI